MPNGAEVTAVDVAPDLANEIVTRGPGDSRIGRIGVSWACFCPVDGQYSYHVTGTLALEHTDGRFRGVLALAVTGDIPRLGNEQLEIEGCFDVQPE